MKDFLITYSFFIAPIASIIVLFLQVLLNSSVSNEIETLKLGLKKSEIKFSRYHELQVDALKRIYSKIVDFYYVSNKIFGNNPSLYHNIYKSNLKQWQTEHLKLKDLCFRERIFFDDTLEKLLETSFDKFLEIFKLIQIQLDVIDEDESRAMDNIINLYDNDEEKETKAVRERIDKLKLDKNGGECIKTINLLRKNIETHFRSMNE